jgi:hypothetical protein
MAIQTLIVGERGERHENSYCRVERVMATKNQLQVEYGVHLSQEQANSGIPPFLILTIFGEYKIDDVKNTWQQAYDIIKSRHMDSVDV